MKTGDSVFDRYAPEYDAWFDTHKATYAAQLALLRRAIPTGGRALEVGVGSGRFAGPLGIPHGLDPSPALLAMARQRGVETVQGLGECLPYHDGTFDYVLMMTVICYVEDIGLSFHEAFRVLRPSGIIIVAFLEKDGEIAVRERAREPKGRFLHHARFLTADAVTAALTEAGCSEVAMVHNRKGFCIITARKG
jgi:ubiquinone/menaquinone biosynthesis C-methylase UbiE